jgi:hypothetical protein
MSSSIKQRLSMRKLDSSALESSVDTWRLPSIAAHRYRLRMALRSPGWTRRRMLLAATAAVVVLATATTWLLWPDDPPAPPRERQYKATTACLLTDDKGLTGDIARAAWAGMQEASLATLIKVQHLAITGPQTPENGLGYYNSLGVQQCTVIVAGGPVPVAAMVQGHVQFPTVKHIAVGGDIGTAPLTTVDPSTPDTIRTGVKTLVSTTA